MDKSARILLVDDDAALVQQYSEILRGQDYEVLQALSGQECLRVTRERLPALVLLDVVLPDLSGVEVCRQIKADLGLADVFVVLFSGRATASDEKVLGLTAGADDYIARPVTTQEFLARVRTILRLRDTTAALRASEGRYRQLVDMLPEAVALLDLEGRLLAINPRGVAMLGYATPSELLAKSAFDLTRPENHARVRTDLATTLANGTLSQMEYNLLNKQGNLVPVELSAGVYKDAHGQSTGFVLVGRDLSERRRAEEQIRLLADVVRSTTEMISITDHENRFTFANRAFLERYGYGWEELLGKTPHVLCSPRNPPGLCEEVFQQTVQGGWSGEILNCTKDGTDFPISLNTSQIKNERGEVIGLMGVAKDISGWKRVERANANLSQLGYCLSAAAASEEAAKIIFESATNLFEWDAGFVKLYSREGDRITSILTVDTVEGQKTPVPPSSPCLRPTALMRRIIEAGAQLLNEADPSSSEVKLERFGASERRSASRMFVPIRYGSVIMGILSLQSYRPRAYCPADLRLFQELADHCGGALRRIEVTEALREAEAKYRAIFENATEGIFQTTLQGRFRSANPALAVMLGYQTPEELIADITDLEHQLYVHPERRQQFKQLIEAQGSVRGFEFEHYRKDRSTIWVSINARAVRDASGALLYYEGTGEDITKRKRAEESLTRSTRVQKALLDNIPDPAWLRDAEERFLACNEALAKFYGLPPEQIVGKTVFELLPTAATRWTAQDEEVKRCRRSLMVEEQLTDAQGRCRWFETVKSPVFNEAGEATGTVGIAHETTERRWFENLLRAQRDFSIFLSVTNDLSKAAEQLLKVALQNEGLECGAVFLVNPQTEGLELASHQNLSASFAERASRFPAEPDGDHLAGGERASSLGHAGPMAGVLHELRQEGLLALESIPIQHRGHVVAVLNVGSRVLPEIPQKNRQAIESLAAQAGGAITRIRAEQALSAHRQLLEKTLQSLFAAVIIVDARTMTIQECNDATTRIFGYSRDELIGHSPALLHVNEATRGEFMQHLDAAVKKRGFLGEFEFRMRHKDGTTFLTEHHLVPIRDEAGQTVTWVGVVRDITERKQEEQALREASRRIFEAQETERMRVARELHDGASQLLASVRMRLKKVEESRPLSPVSKERLARCSNLLLQALEENRRIAQNLRPADLDALGLAEACRNLCKQFRSRTQLAVKCRITGIVERFAPAVELNLFRIIQEALNNVEKHAHAKSVRLDLAFQEGSILLRIQDDGRGFDTHAPVVFGRLSARRIFSGPGHSAGFVLFFCDGRHLSVTRP